MDNPFLALPAGGGNVVLDLDGVVFLGSEVIPGAGAALHRLREVGWTVAFATNNATRSRAYLEERITEQTGFAPDPDLIVTSAISAARMIRPEDHPIFLVGEDGLRSTLGEFDVPVTEDSGFGPVRGGGSGSQVRLPRLAAASSAVRRGARFVATNSDVTFPTPSGQVPGAGSIVAAVAAAAGVHPEFAGKPFIPMVEAVQLVLGPGETWMIGDRPETDLAFATAAAWRSVLTLSGVTTDPASVPAEWSPSLVVASIADLFADQ